MPQWLFVILSQLLVVGLGALVTVSPGYAENVQETVRKSLVHLFATGTPRKGDNIGQPDASQSQATGFVISDDGFILTARHLFNRLEADDAVNIRIVGSVGDEDARDIPIFFVSELSQLDMVLLKADYPFDFVVPPALALKPVAAQDVADLNLLTAGFVNATYTPEPMTFVDEDSDVPYAWTLQGQIEHGQSGSPVFTEDAKVIGILKGSQETDPQHSLMVPIQYAIPLTGFLIVQELQRKVDVLSAMIGELSEGKPPISLRLTDLEANVEELKTQFDWTAETSPDGSVVIRYNKIISGGANVDKIKVQITPNMRMKDGNGGVYSGPAPDLKLRDDGDDTFDRQPGTESGKTGLFVIPGVQGRLENLVDLAATAVGGREPFRDLEVRLVPFLNGEPVPLGAADSIEQRFSVFPNYSWNFH